MLNIISRWENANQNHKELPLYTQLEWQALERLTIPSADEDVKQPELSYTAGRNI